jgi:hypothetical protein
MSKELDKFLIYNTPNNEVRVNVYVENETLWLTQKAMGELFGVVKSTVSEHLNHIFESGELEKNATVRNFRTVQTEGSRQVTRDLEYYNLDAVISVGYRVNSSKATQFRIWATQTLKEFIIKGFVLDDQRLKEGQNIFGKDYFKELLRRVRSIRASERRIYQQVTDIFAACSIDYNPHSEITKTFYAYVQNKFHFAITGKTAAEIIHTSVNKDKENMGLTTWKNAPDGRIIKSDIIVAKNYLQEKEIMQLERTVSSYFDYIESLIERENTFTMEQLSESVNKFLTFNEYKILEGKGTISKLQADKKAILAYEDFNKSQKILSDFDKHLKKLNP